MKIYNYIIVKKYGTKYYPKYSARLTANSPALGANEVAIRIELELPDNIFDKPAFEASITVPQEAVSKPIIEADVIDNVQDIIKQQTGFSVTLTAVEKEEE